MDELERLLALLEDNTLEDVLEICNLTPEEALTYLWADGQIALPPYLENE